MTSYLPLFPLLVVALISLAFVPFLKRSHALWLVLGGLATLLSLYAAWTGWLENGPADRIAYFLDLVFLTGLLLTLLISKDYLLQEGIPSGEYVVLLLFATFGMMVIGHGTDLIVIFLGIEIMSLSLYILAGIKKGVLRSYEASLKYFILGSVASGFFLYGIALAYGISGSTSLASLAGLSQAGFSQAGFSTMSSDFTSTLVLMSIAFLFIGVAFKVAAAPFHLWSPDVYEGAPTAVTAFMASSAKAAGFAVLIRLVMALGGLASVPWGKALWTVSALTMTLGNVAALRQTNIKRMLAYSSIAHAGYALVGMTAAILQTGKGLGPVLFYLVAYSLTTIGTFAVVIALGKRGEAVEEMTDFIGLAERHPLLATSMTFFLLSLIGIPATVGFVGKFLLFSAATEAGLYGLVVIGVLNSVVSAYYYLGPVVKMYFQKGSGLSLPPLSYPLAVAVFLCLFLVLYLGLFPSALYLMSLESVKVQ